MFEENTGLGGQIFAYIVGIVLGAAICIATPLLLAFGLGFAEEARWVMATIDELSIVLRLAACAALGVIGFFLLLIAGVFLYVIGSRIVRGFVALTNIVAEATARFAEFVEQLCVSVFRAAVFALTYPIRFVFDVLADGYARLNAKVMQSIDNEKRLRALYERDFKADFISYRAFKKYWKALQNGEEPPYPGSEEREREETRQRQENKRQEQQKQKRRKGSHRDPYQSALRELGLSEPFTKAEFKARYRMRMKEVHPDITGDTQAAVRVNDAKAVIMKKKGWTA